MKNSDFGIWATWYDLDATDVDNYLHWAHNTYLPSLQQQTSYTWAAHYRYRGGGAQMDQVKTTVVMHTQDHIGQGSQFLMLVGAPSVHAFFNPYVEDIPNDQRTQKMLELRKGVRTLMLTQEACIHGPSIHTQNSPGPSPAIQMGTLRAKTIESEFDLIKWYAQYRLPSMEKMTGCVRTSKWSAVAGWAKHGILYEFESLDHRLRYFEKGHESLALETTHWTHRITRASFHAPGSPFIGERIWPAV